MSHICIAYSLSDEDKNTDLFSKNIERAINHIKRGTLDCYKIIIKDFFILMKNTDKYSMIPKDKDKLLSLRINEYQNLGKDMNKILTDYKKYATFLLCKIKA
ncbi:TPA: hypothetical protein RZK18_000109 [Campylobacter coli]|nr:hypothetical protein [Campylobacter coli]